MQSGSHFAKLGACIELLGDHDMPLQSRLKCKLTLQMNRRKPLEAELALSRDDGDNGADEGIQFTVKPQNNEVV